jgi:hypothetical protein
VKPKEEQLWHYQIREGKLRFRQALGTKEFGKWRVIKGKNDPKGKNIWWKIKPGESSGIPQALFTSLRDSLFEDAVKLKIEEREFTRMLSPLRRGLKRAAKLFGCKLETTNDTRFNILQGDKKSMAFLIVDYQNHRPKEFYKRRNNGTAILGRQRQPVRALGDLTTRLRESRKRVREFERGATATLRWLIVVFGDGTPWLVPAKSRED